MCSSTFYFWFWRVAYILFVTGIFLIVFFSLFGCTHKPEIVYQPVEVLVPVPVYGPPLPVPEPAACPPRPEGWRGSAAYLKGCYEAALLKIEELQHIIVSHNESIEP
jgi:hypothetical protein